MTELTGGRGDLIVRGTFSWAGGNGELGSGRIADPAGLDPMVVGKVGKSPQMCTLSFGNEPANGAFPMRGIREPDGQNEGPREVASPPKLCSSPLRWSPRDSKMTKLSLNTKKYYPYLL